MSSSRRCNKPLMEKRRRARINDCLTELKVLVLQAMNKDTNQYSKLEKADILEMTVKHLKSLQRQQSTDPFIVSKYRAGYNECASEVSRFLVSADLINPEIKEHMLSHLANSLNRVPSVSQKIKQESQPPQSSPLEQFANRHNRAPGYIDISDPSLICGMPTTTNTPITSLPGYTYNNEQFFASDGEGNRQISSFYDEYNRRVNEELKHNDYVKFHGCSLDRKSPTSASEAPKVVRHGGEFGQRQSLSPNRPESAAGLSDSMWRPW